MDTARLDVLGVVLNYEFEKKKNAGIRPLFDVMKGHGVLSDIISVEVSRFMRQVLILKNYDIDIKKWRFKYHLDISLRNLRSRKAKRILDKSKFHCNAILQYGSEFHLGGIRHIKDIPRFSYHDNNLYGYLKGASEFPPIKKTIHEALAYESLVYKDLTGIFTKTKYLRDIFIQDFKIPKEKVYYVGMGSPFHNIQDEEKQYDGRTILFVAIHSFKLKGGEVLLEAFPLVRKEIPDARLLIVGQDLNFTMSGVECIGFIDKNIPGGEEKLRDLYRAASVLVMPSFNEAAGNVFLEAMTHKLPCIGANCCAMPEIIGENNCGFVIEPGNSKELAEKICMLLKDEILMREMGQNGFNTIKTEYSLEKVYQRMAEIMNLYV